MTRQAKSSHTAPWLFPRATPSKRGVIGREPRLKRSIPSDAAQPRFSMSPLLIVSALCVVSAILAPLAFSLLGLRPR